MAVVFPITGNPYWPLPSDYPSLDKEGQRKARVNAASIGGKPMYEAAAWGFFRETYLVPKGPQWYKTGYSPSPPAHYQWVRDWYEHPMLVHAAPRGTCKTTLNLEDILRKICTMKYWEAVLFLSTMKFCSDRLGRLMDQIEHNDLILRDFGKLKGRGRGYQWNRGSTMELVNGCKVTAFPIEGASLGTRPSGLIVLDDVEKSDEQVITPTNLRDHAEAFFFNAIYPMARSPGFRIPIRIIGTLYNQRMFIFWLYDTKDPRVEGFFERRLMTIPDLNWDVFGPEWQEEEKKRLGPTVYAAQCMNSPGSDADRMLKIHPELCTYWLEKTDEAAYNDPFNSNADVVTHQLAGWHKSITDTNPVPKPRRVVRKWSDVVGNMRRFITVDSARTTRPESDWSVVHVMGYENDDAHRDTLYSLDVWMGQKRPEEVIRVIYQMALRWGVNLIGVEAYEVYTEFYERVRDNLPTLYGTSNLIPRILPLKFPTKLDKPSRAMMLEWRFNQFRIKLPIDRRNWPKPCGVADLWDQIERATEDWAMMKKDDVIDTLCLSQLIGKPHKAAGPDVAPDTDPVKLLRAGKFTHDETTGLSVLSGMNASEIPDDVLRTMMMKRYDDALDEAGLDDEDVDVALAYMNLPQEFLRGD